MALLTLKLEDGVGTVVVAVDRIGSDLFFSPRVELMLDAEAFGMVQVLHPVVHQRVFIPLFRLESALHGSSDERSRRHLLIDGPKIQRVGVEAKDLLARSGEIVPDVGLSPFVVSVKHDGWPPCKPAFDGIVNVAVGVIEHGKGSSGLAPAVEEHPAC